MITYIVTAWYFKAEANFSFGPFNTEEEAEAFANNTLDQEQTAWDSAEIIAVNNPALYGTGDEITN